MDHSIKQLLAVINSFSNDLLRPLLVSYIEWFSRLLQLHFSEHTSTLVPHQGDIYEVDLGYNIGSELNKKRLGRFIGTLTQGDKATLYQNLYNMIGNDIKQKPTPVKE